MSHIPSVAMKHAHAEPVTPPEPSAADKARAAIEHVEPPLWTMVAAGVAGAVATALFLSLRSSAPAKAPPRRRAPARRKKAD